MTNHRKEEEEMHQRSLKEKKPPRSIWRGTLLVALLSVGVFAVACGKPVEEIKPTVTRIPNPANAPVVDVAETSPTADLAQVTNAPTTETETGSAATEAPAEQPTEAMTAGGSVGDVAKGEQLAASMCLACHSVTGGTIVGPTWKGLYGHEVTLSDGTTVTADEAYIAQSIRDPNSQVVDGFPAIMPPFDYLSDQDIADLIAYIKTLE